MRVVLTSFGSYGDLYPYLGLGCALRRRGHDPVLAVPPLYRKLVEREGLRFHPVRPDLDVQDRGLATRIMDPVGGADAIFGELLLPSLEATYDDLYAATADAELLVTHPASLAGPIVAAKRGLRWASGVLAPLSFFSAYDPIVPPPAPWVHGLTSRSLVLSRWFLHQTDRLTRKWADPVARFRQRLGLDPGGNAVTGGQHSPYLVLALFSRVLASPQPDWPARAQITGPIFYSDPEHATLPRDLAEFLDRGAPPIVFTLGTSAVEAAGSFYEVSAKAVARMGQRAVLLVGRHDGNRPAVGAPGVLAVDFASHEALFPRASVVVHQGGAGTLHQALRAGRPMLVVPHAHDQPDNASRATRLGVARTLYPKRYCPSALEAVLGKLLGDRAFAARAAEVAAVVRDENGAERACDALEALPH